VGDVSIYLSSLNGVATAAWYAGRLGDRGCQAVICTPSRLVDDAKRVLPDDRLVLQPVAPFTSTERFLARAHATFADYASDLVVGDNPANLRYFGPRSRFKGPAHRAIRRACGRIPSRLVNRAAARAFNGAAAWRFPSKHVLVISFPEQPLLLCDSTARIDTVVDSWDHPVRKTSGYVTHTAIAWNRDLARDWQRYQGAGAVRIGPAHKLMYALSADRDGAGGPGTTLMYPMVTSRFAGEWFEAELQVVDAIAEAAREAGWEVLVKPKPMTSRDELAEVAARHDNVSLGTFLDSGAALDYVLTDAYNDVRLRELGEVDLVVNSGTTFGLDAACAGRPLLQLDLSRLEDARAFADANRNYHIQHHLCRVAGTAGAPPRNLRELGALVKRELAPDRRAAHAQSAARLRRWVDQPAGEFEATLESLAPPVGAAERPVPLANNELKNSAY